MLSYFQNLAAGIENKLADDPGPFVARKRFALETARLGVRLFSGEERVAWCGVLAPFDLLGAMGVTSCFAEFVGAMLASNGLAGPLLQAAEEGGYSTDSCAYHRAVWAATRQGVMPQPDFLVGTSGPCTGGLAVLEQLARHFEKDFFALHVPPDDTPEAVAYVAEQLRELTDFVGARTGAPLDPQRLRESVERSNRATALLHEVYALAKNVPSPARLRDLVNLGIVVPLLFGTEAAVDVTTAYRDEFRRKVSAGSAGVPGERIRLLWLQNRIQFRNPLEELLAEEYGAVVVADELNDVTWQPIDPDDPFVGMARRMLSTPLVLSAERRIEHLKAMADAYRVDGFINPCHWGCRQGTGVRGLLQQGLKEAGFPLLNLEVDCVDERNFSEGQLRTRVGAFLEMLGGEG